MNFLWISFLGLPDTRALKSGAVAFKEIVEGCAEAQIIQEKAKYRYTDITQEWYVKLYSYTVIHIIQGLDSQLLFPVVNLES